MWSEALLLQQKTAGKACSSSSHVLIKYIKGTRPPKHRIKSEPLVSNQLSEHSLQILLTLTLSLFRAAFLSVSRSLFKTEPTSQWI